MEFKNALKLEVHFIFMISYYGKSHSSSLWMGQQK